jgi:hypothetical protein
VATGLFIFCLVVAGVSSALLRGAIHGDVVRHITTGRSDELRLAISRHYRVAHLGLSLFFVILVLAMTLTHPVSSGIEFRGTVLFSSFFLAFAAALALKGIGPTVSLRGATISHRAPLRAESSFAISLISSVRVTPILGDLLIVAGGRAIRIPLAMSGVGDLARALLKHCPAGAMKGDTRARLSELGRQY